MHRSPRGHVWPTEGTALSPRPQRVTGGRHAHRRRGSGAGAVTVPVAAVAAVVAVAVGAYVLMSATGPSGRSAQAATVSVEARHAVAMLERERQQMIAMDEASRSTQVLAAPKLASTAAPVAPKDTGVPVAPGGTAAQVAPGGHRRPALVRASPCARPGGSGHCAGGGGERVAELWLEPRTATSAAWTTCGPGRAGGGPTPRTPAALMGSRRRCPAPRWQARARTGRRIQSLRSGGVSAISRPDTAIRAPRGRTGRRTGPTSEMS